jgi:NagD protein
MRFSPPRTFVFDMDGTVYLGDDPVPGVLDFIRALPGKGYDFAFFSNNSSKSPADCAARLARMGLTVPEEKIMLSSHVAADYLKEHHAGQSCMLLGNTRLADILAQAGIRSSRTAGDYVLLGFDTTLDYAKLETAVRLLAAGKPYYATHPDVNCPTANGFMPDAGAMAALLEASTGRRPDLIFGKPHTATVDYITRRLGLRRRDLIFVGDRLETDIQIGAVHGVTTLLTLTGATTRAMYVQSAIRADFVVENLGECVADL